MANVRIYKLARLIGRKNIEFGENIIIDDFVFIYAKKKIKIGNYVHIGCFSSIVGGDEVILDDFSGLSMGCRIFTGSEDFLGVGFGNPTVPSCYRNLNCGPVRIGRFALLGANTVVLPNVIIGEGVTVGANSVVTRDLDPWGVYVGNKRIRQRDKEGVLNNYRHFLKSQDSKRKC